MKAKLIGEVIDLSGPNPGYAGRIARYPSGRKLPAPRLLLDDHGRPFATRAAALAAINQWRADPRSVRHLHPEDVVETPKPSCDMTVPLANSAMEPDRTVKRHKRTAPARELPKVEKMPAPTPTRVERTSDQTLIDMFVAQGFVTRCEPMVRQNMNPRRKGGILPGHLDPRRL